MSEPFLAQIKLFSFNFAPKGWAQCNGQLMPLAQNQALFSLLGTTYGGDGSNNFALPDLRGRVPMGFGNGHTIGEKAGAESVTLDAAGLPSHNHPISGTATENCRNDAGNQQTPVGNVLAVDAAGVATVYSNIAPNASMSPAAIAIGGSATAAPTGGGQAHFNVQPYLALTYCIALQGVFPPRT